MMRLRLLKKRLFVTLNHGLSAGGRFQCRLVFPKGSLRLSVSIIHQICQLKCFIGHKWKYDRDLNLTLPSPIRRVRERFIIHTQRTHAARRHLEFHSFNDKSRIIRQS